MSLPTSHHVFPTAVIRNLRSSFFNVFNPFLVFEYGIYRNPLRLDVTSSLSVLIRIYFLFRNQSPSSKRTLGFDPEISTITALANFIQVIMSFVIDVDV